MDIGPLAGMQVVSRRGHKDAPEENMVQLSGSEKSKLND